MHYLLDLHQSQAEIPQQKTIRFVLPKWLWQKKYLCQSHRKTRVTKEGDNIVLWIIHSDNMQSGCEIPLHFFCLFTDNLNKFGTILAVTLNRIIKPQQIWEKN